MNNLINQKIYISDEIKRNKNIKKREKKKILWKIICNFMEKKELSSWDIFLEYKSRSYILEITELYEEKIAIKKIKPLLEKYILWRLWNPDNGIRYLKLRDSWYEPF